MSDLGDRRTADSLDSRQEDSCIESLQSRKTVTVKDAAGHPPNTLVARDIVLLIIHGGNFNGESQHPLQKRDRKLYCCE